MGNLSPHFRTEEFEKATDPVPAEYKGNLVRLANLLEGFREVVGVPFRITSGYRSPARNAAVGGADSSQHTTAEAADFQPVGISLWTFQKRVKAASSLPEFGQLIYYPFTTGHVHLSLPQTGKKRNQVLVKLAEGGYANLSDLLLGKFPGAAGSIGVILILVALFLVFRRKGA